MRHTVSVCEAHSEQQPPEILQLAELQYKAESVVIEELNPKLDAAGLPRVVFVADAVYQLKNKYLATAHKAELKAVLVEVFELLTGSSDDAMAAVDQWPEVMSWHHRRVACAHPLGDGVIDPGKLNNLKSQVTSEAAYAPVRGAAKVLIAAAERNQQGQAP